ncbi:MAG TPA: bifunctional phosphoribosylaminoimidazolecarboxamide formyltransferase/IMP cyclohydrolase [Thermoanaerobaculia bacterium]|jgi:phosphoribosylaminoimidazolecarboxamide formyltransferase/IMP cyclohydrolase|nr:bifunctional phosphoribosylaminoimidazolecarboxamide formyltransferase/IMP cyclohydrolase [Thermoanaerobaculia bacterium]
MLPARRALVSVFDKTGLEEMARGLYRLGVEIVSTGGTLKFLQEKGIPVVAVSDVTGFPEMLEGRVKTLHPKVHGGILAKRSDSEHLDALAEHGIERIDLVVVNLYPFRETVARGASFAETVEMIDVGGPTMVRAAAKNFDGVAVVVDPADYPRVLAALEQGRGVVPEPLRRELALKAFRQTASYDAAISEWLGGQSQGSAGTGNVGEGLVPSLSAREGTSPSPTKKDGGDGFPERSQMELRREMVLRYGENPHQGGAVYADANGPGVFGGFQALQGKELSWNNLLDADAARKMAGLFPEPAVIIVKHNNPCGIGRGADLAEAYRRAVATDPVSAFGSVIALNRLADGALAEAMADLFVEVLLAPGFDAAARARFGAKKNLRLIECPTYQPARDAVELRAIDGGFLAQPPDAFADDPATWTCPTRRQPTPEERRALEFAWRVVRYVKSNAIVVANADQTVGVGAGQMSRVDSCRLAVEKAQLPVAGTVAASDAFFPFRDGLDVLAKAGVVAVAQPGGSKRDDEIIAAADEAGMAMLMTGVRHFRH